MLFVATSSNISSAFYEAFPPSEGPYVSGSASSQLNWEGENFESYDNHNEIECSWDMYIAS